MTISSGAPRVPTRTVDAAGLAYQLRGSLLTSSAILQRPLPGHVRSHHTLGSMPAELTGVSLEFWPLAQLLFPQNLLGPCAPFAGAWTSQGLSVWF